MAVVEVRLPALTAHVRTARMVCVTAARRAGLGDEFVDELRLAVGEACARAVELHAAHAPQELVTVRVVDDLLGLTVTVHDCGPAAGPTVEDVAGLLDSGSTDEQRADPDVALAVLAGLVDEVDVTAAEGEGTTVTLRWPLPRRIGGTPSTILADR